MPDAPLTPFPSNNPYNNEVSISDLLLKLWAKRGSLISKEFKTQTDKLKLEVITKTGPQEYSVRHDIYSGRNTIPVIFFRLIYNNVDPFLSEVG